VLARLAHEIAQNLLEAQNVFVLDFHVHEHGGHRGLQLEMVAAAMSRSA
jgi:hypothetical protein